MGQAIEGWGYPSNSSVCKKHYFVENISLCEFYRNGTNFVFLKPILSTNTCKLCYQRLSDQKEQEDYEKSDRPKFS